MLSAENDRFCLIYSRAGQLIKILKIASWPSAIDASAYQFYSPDVREHANLVKCKNYHSH